MADGAERSTGSRARLPGRRVRAVLVATAVATSAAGLLPAADAEGGTVVGRPGTSQPAEPAPAGPVDDPRVPFPNEAHAWSAVYAKEWDAALLHARTWLADQPFDANAARLGSYVAAVGLESWDTTLELADLGLLANPADATLNNNRAYALIEMNRLDVAAEALDEARRAARDADQRVAVNATAGLLALRSGRTDEGRALYLRAIDLARRTGDANCEAMARAMYLRELISARDVDLEALLRSLERLSPKVTDSGVLQCIERATDLASR